MRLQRRRVQGEKRFVYYFLLFCVFVWVFGCLAFRRLLANDTIGS